MRSQKGYGVVISYAAQFFHILSGFLYTPLMLKMLGQAEYGLYSLASSTVATLSVLSFGFSGCYLYYYNKIKEEDDLESLARFNGMYLVIFLIVSGIVMVCGIGIVANIRLLFGSGLNEVDYQKACILIIILIVNLAVTFPATVFTSIINANEKFIFEQMVVLVTNIASVVLNVLVLVLGCGSIGLTIATLAISVIRLLVSSFYCLTKLKTRFRFSGFQLELLKNMFGFAFYIFLNQIVNQINNQLDKVILGRFCGVEIVAIYSIGSTLCIYYQQFGCTIGNVFAPEINRIVAKSRANNDEKAGNEFLVDVFIKVSRIQFIMLGLVLLGFIFVGEEFVRLWAGEGYEQSYYIAVGLMTAGTISCMQTAGDTIQRAKFQHKTRALVYFVMALLNVCISIPLLKRYSALGAAIGTMIVWILGDLIFLNWYYYKKLGLNMVRYWRNVLPLLVPMFLSFGCGYLLKRFISITGWMKLATFVMLFSAVYFFFMMTVGLNRREKMMIRSVVDDKKVKSQ